MYYGSLFKYELIQLWLGLKLDFCYFSISSNLKTDVKRPNYYLQWLTKDQIYQISFSLAPGLVFFRKATVVQSKWVNPGHSLCRPHHFVKNLYLGVVHLFFFFFKRNSCVSVYTRIYDYIKTQDNIYNSVLGGKFTLSHSS